MRSEAARPSPEDSDAPSQRLGSKHRIILAVIVVALLAMRLLILAPRWSWAESTPPSDWRLLSGDTVTYDVPAFNLISGQGYSSCLTPPCEPSVLRTPSYPLLLAGIYALFGRRPGAVILANTLLETSSLVLLFLIALRWISVGWALAFLALAGVLSPAGQLLGWRLSEPLSAALLALVLYFAVADRPSPTKLGASAAALFLCRPVFVLLPVILGGWAWMSKRWSLAKLGIFAATALVVWSPWVIRNAVAFHRFVPLSAGSSGVSLWIGTWHSGSTPWTIRRKGGFIERSLPAAAFDSEPERVAISAALQAYSKSYFSTAGIELNALGAVFQEWGIERIRKAPGAWLARRAKGTLAMIDPPLLLRRWVRLGDLPAYFAFGLLLPLLLYGAGYCLLRARALPVVLAFFYTWAIHFPTHGEARYLAPAYPLGLMLAFIGAQSAAAWLSGRLAHARASD